MPLTVEDSACLLKEEESAVYWWKFKEFVVFASFAEVCLRHVVTSLQCDEAAEEATGSNHWSERPFLDLQGRVEGLLL